VPESQPEEAEKLSRRRSFFIEMQGGGEMTPYVISVLNPEGTNAEAFCDPANPANFQFKNKRRSEPGTQLAANPRLTCSSLTKE
jgi:hypothetical protein